MNIAYVPTAHAADYRRQVELGRSRERTRIKLILRSQEARTRMSTALHLALDTDLTVDEALAQLRGDAVERSGSGSLGDSMRQRFMVVTNRNPHVPARPAADLNGGLASSMRARFANGGRHD